MVRVMLMVLGWVPIGCLCLALFGVLPLDVSARALVLPALALAVALGLNFPEQGRVAAVGFLAGMAATVAYDVVRLSLVAVGVWPDFNPPIGQHAHADPQAHPVWGYVWRFVGNGGGMGMTFALLPWRHARAGMVYGVVVCVGLYVTLLLAPGAQDRLFVLTPVTALAALAGHLDYGAVLGWLTARWSPRDGTRTFSGWRPGIPRLP
jgi:hypothetical protein